MYKNEMIDYNDNQGHTYPCRGALSLIDMSFGQDIEEI
jgi:hypothetical protein